MPVDIFRVAIGNADGIKIFVAETHDQTSATFPTFLHCLCCCCREAVNRAKVKELEGLSILLNVLKSKTEVCRSQHENVLSALLNFYYDEMSLKYLASQGFIQVLVQQLLSSILVKDKGQLGDQKDKDTTGYKQTKDKECNINEVQGPSKNECNITASKVDSAKSDGKQVNSLRKESVPRQIPRRDPLLSEGGYTSGMSPESSHSGSGRTPWKRSVKCDSDP